MNPLELTSHVPASSRRRQRRSVLAISLLLGGLAAGPLRAGIPEPDLVWYGKVMTVVGGNTVRLTTGTLSWRLDPPGGGTPWVITTQLTNINDQFSFVLRVPCESAEPAIAASPGTVLLQSPANSYSRVAVSLNGQPLTISQAPTSFAPTLADRGRAERIDLALGTLPPDSDGDGMSDDWELLYFGADGAHPDDDFDGDGLSNLREFRAGTHPKNAQSVFAVVEVARVPAGLRLRWSSVAGKTYRVRRASTLLENPLSYMSLQANISATPPMNELTDSSVGAGAMFFYLIEVQP